MVLNNLMVIGVFLGLNIKIIFQRNFLCKQNRLQQYAKLTTTATKFKRIKNHNDNII